MAAIALVACQKNQSLQQDHRGGLKSDSTEARYEDYVPEEIEDEITAFLDDVENESVGNMPLNEEVWNIEAAIGYTHRYQLFEYSSSDYKTLQYEVDIVDEKAQGTSARTAYNDLAAEMLEVGEHFIWADVHAQYTGGSIATLIARVKVTYDKDPWNNRDISVSERQAGNPKDCDDPPVSKNNTGHDLVAKKALAKYRNSISYDPTAYYYFTSVVEVSPSHDKLPGGDNPLYPNDHPKGGTYPYTCVTETQMENYRDHVKSQLSSLNGTVLDCKLMFNEEYDGWNNNTGTWSYIEETGTPITAYKAGVILGQRILGPEPE